MRSLTPINATLDIKDGSFSEIYKGHKSLKLTIPLNMSHFIGTLALIGAAMHGVSAMDEMKQADF
jgi:hypothetical protein